MASPAIYKRVRRFVIKGYPHITSRLPMKNSYPDSSSSLEALLKSPLFQYYCQQYEKERRSPHHLEAIAQIKREVQLRGKVFCKKEQP